MREGGEEERGGVGGAPLCEILNTPLGTAPKTPPVRVWDHYSFTDP